MSDARREKRNFALVDGNGEEIGTYSGSQPRDAALKAARRGNKEIVLREKGTNKLHYFRGKRVLVKAPKDAPKWIADAAVKREGKIYKAEVGKVGTATLNSPRLADNDRSLFQVPGGKDDKVSIEIPLTRQDLFSKPYLSARRSFADDGFLPGNPITTHDHIRSANDAFLHGTPTTTHDHRKPKGKASDKGTPPEEVERHL